MALTLVKSPATVSLAGNDILFKVNSDNQYSSAGTKANLGLAWATGDSNTDAFTLSWGNNELEFTCATTPDDSGLQYPPYVSGTVNAWAESIVPYIRANYQLSKDFIISWNNAFNVIQIQAYEKGADYSLTLNTGTSNVTEDSNAAGTDPVARDFYGIVCRVWLPGDGPEDYVLIGEDNLVPDEDGNVLFKIQEYLNSQFSFDFEWPEGTITFLFKKENAFKKFFIEYAEKFEGLGKKLFSTETISTYVITGGLDHIALAKLNEEEKTWWDYYLERKDALTWQPREMIVNKFQPVKLTYLVWKSGVTAINLKVKIVYDDATTYTITKTSTAVQYDIFEAILSYQKLGLSSYSPSKTINYYEVWIQDQSGTRLSVSRYFYVDQYYRENETVFIFENSLGRADVVRFTGISEQNSDFERSTSERIPQEGFTWRDHQVGDYDSLEVQKININTGWMNELSKRPKQMADYLREFYLSKKIYQLVNNRLYPIRITGKSQFINKSDETLSFTEFEAERGYTDKYFSQDENIHPSIGWESKFESEEFLNPQ